MNDELFLDYGNEWEKAWRRHVRRYPYKKNNISPNNNDNQNSIKYISAHEYNYRFQDAFVRTMQEQLVDPYPSNLQIRCHRKLFLEASVPHGIYVWTEQDYGLPCRILDRFIERRIIHSSPNLELYTIQIEYVNHERISEQFYDRNFYKTKRYQEYENEFVNDNDDDDTIIPKVTWVQRTDVPRSAIRFFDIPYTTDMHLPTSFRHYIGIPDSMFPNQWKNYLENQ